VTGVTRLSIQVLAEEYLNVMGPSINTVDWKTETIIMVCFSIFISFGKFLEQEMLRARFLNQVSRVSR